MNAINRQFYEITAEEFDQTRQQAWGGWQKLLSHLHVEHGFSVLDVGCGNGRFGVFLGEHFQMPFSYHGIDNNTRLLGYAKNALKGYPHIQVQLDEQDIVQDELPKGGYDLVVVFGVMHHIPGTTARLQFMRDLAQRVSDGGRLVFACWRFYEYERFRQRIVAWDASLDVEKHDYLLDWRRGERALRYCHYVDDAEHDALIAASGLDEVVRFRADGASGDANCYSVLQR